MNAYDRFAYRLLAAVVAAMCLGLLVAEWVSAEEIPALCSGDMKVPLEIEVTNERICAHHGKVAPCFVQCGKLVFKKNCTRVVWRGCEGAEALVPQPSPVPTRSPLPTAAPTNAPSACEKGDPAFCWAKGARLTVGGRCWSQCNCILRGGGECAS